MKIGQLMWVAMISHLPHSKHLRDAGIVAALVAGAAACGSAGEGGGAIAGTGGATGPDVTCPSPVLPPGTTTATVDIGMYTLHLPPGYAGNSPIPLVVDLHSYTRVASYEEGISGWEAKANKEGFAVTWPDSNPTDTSTAFNAGICCFSSVDDMTFLRKVVAQISKSVCVDPKRVYLTGLSNGGIMTEYSECRAADLFAAGASVAGAWPGTQLSDCAPSRPVPMILFHGTDDTVVGYNGGGLIPNFLPTQQGFANWAQTDGCTDQASTSSFSPLCKSYTHCTTGVEVSLCLVTTTAPSGHVIYTNNQNVSIPDMAWDFFKRFPLP